VLALAVAVTAATVAATPPSAAGLSELEARGKRLYITGEGSSGEPVTAVLGETGVEVPATALPCAGCHGRDGRGRPEGGVTPSDITWEALTRSYGVRHESGREHPPYTLRWLKRAITLGVDPASQELHVAMPRYHMSLADMDALLAYLQKLGTDRDPGIAEQVLRVGTLVPGEGPAAPVGSVMVQVLRAFFDRLNRGGGLYGRRVELVVGELPGDPARRPGATARFLEEEPVFALVAAMVAGADREIEALVEEREIPSIAPLTLHPRARHPVPRYTFYLHSGFLTEGRVLLDAAAEAGGAVGTPEGRPRLVLLVPDASLFTEDVPELLEEVAEAFAPRVRHLPEGALASPATEALAGELAEEGVDVILTFHPVGLEPVFLRALAAAGTRPRVLAPAVLVGPEFFDLPVAIRERVLFSAPTLPADQTARGAQNYAELAAAAALPAEHPVAQRVALAAAELLVEGLERSGRDLSRERLVEALEGLYDHATELTPPLTFTANRRIGALGAYVLEAVPDGPGLRPVGGFRSPH
jgi:ABC-type branched-subunit amino acid transport system substrate-binding protein